MIKNTLTRLTVPLGILVLLTLSLFTDGNPAVTAHRGTMPINPVSDAPIRVSYVKVKTDDHWMSPSSVGKDDVPDRLALQVENISRKEIAYLEIKIMFPDLKLQGKQTSLPVRYGRIPLGNVQPERLASIPPGTKINLSLPQDADQGRKRLLLEKGRVSLDVNEVAANIGVVIFTDRTAWSRGLLHHPDPSNPLRWNVVGEMPDESASSQVFSHHKVVVSSNSLPASRSSCGRYAGFEWLYCCDDLYVGSAIVVPDRHGNAIATLVTAYCSSGASCNYYQVDPCQ